MNTWRRRFWILAGIVAAIPLLAALYAAIRFLPDRPVTYDNVEDHFKYGSTGGDRNAGFPYWIWRALPVVFADKLPQNGGNGYEAFGMVYETDARGHRMDRPVGWMKRRNLGFDRVFVNCAICHHTTVRLAPNQPPRVYSGTGATNVDLGAFEVFLFSVATDERFDAEHLLPAVEKLSGRKLGPTASPIASPSGSCASACSPCAAVSRISIRNHGGRDASIRGIRQRRD